MQLEEEGLCLKENVGFCQPLLFTCTDHHNSTEGLNPTADRVDSFCQAPTLQNST